MPNPTGLPGVFEGHCPPHYLTLRAAEDHFCERKFGKGGPFHPDTPGPWKESRKVRASAQVHDEKFRDRVALQAQYAFDTFGKFPATVPTIFILMYLQSHHLDLEYYDTVARKYNKVMRSVAIVGRLLFHRAESSSLMNRMSKERQIASNH
ncbi:MAG TPA: hypothetical protein VF026_02710 [Ktedonobacteraceae bacterium]